MFDFSCTSACNPPNPTANTVKVSMEDIAKRDAEAADAKIKEEEKRINEELAAKEAARVVAEREAKEQEERRKAEEEESKRQQEELERKAKEEAEAAAAEAEKKRADQDSAQLKNEVMAWLKKQGFTAVNAPKKSFFSSTYALHKAAEAGNVKMVGGLLEQGANPALKNSSGKTAKEVVMQKKKADSHKEVLALLTAAADRA
mmetsp:Transcript_14118/g.33646  ORF Transcript_14118/g.33646 Transcript_14118/m.33646 type:complete len:202 (+) Transcript_14118:83-688(+)